MRPRPSPPLIYNLAIAPPPSRSIFLICNSCPLHIPPSSSLSLSLSLCHPRSIILGPRLRLWTRHSFRLSHPRLATRWEEGEGGDDVQGRRRARLPRRGGEGDRLLRRRRLRRLRRRRASAPAAPAFRPPLELPRHAERHLEDPSRAPQVGDRRLLRRGGSVGAFDPEGGPECCCCVACLCPSCQAEHRDPRRSGSADDLLRWHRRRLRPPSQQGGEHPETCGPRDPQIHRTGEPGGRGDPDRPRAAARQRRFPAHEEKVAGEIFRET